MLYRNGDSHMNVHDKWNGQNWRWIDHSSSGLQYHPLQSFALDDTLCTSVGAGLSDPVMRSWVHSPTIVLGIQDSRLPYVMEGCRYLEEQGYRVIVRNSGGLAVVLDEGIYNLSLIMKENRGISINSGYDFMWELMKEVFSDAPLPIEAYEVVGSYCPGSYDLSMGGRKFAGISQRRIRGGIAVQIYLAVTEYGEERAELLKNFYSIAVNGESVRYEWPRINPKVMTSLSELYNRPLDINDVTKRLLTTVVYRHGAKLETSTLTPKELQQFDSLYQRVVDRNDKALT